MNYIKHLAGFFDKISVDERLNPSHVSLYVSLFQFWNACRFHNPISISRGEVMRVSKIYSKATYHKCIKELNDFGYLKYEPSYNPFKGSLVYLYNFQTTTEQAVNRKRTKNETSIEQALVPYTNNLNNTNRVNDEHARTKNNSKSFVVDSDKRKKVAPKKESRKPTFAEVENYFAAKKWASLEAKKFFNHYQSNGWLVGKVPMKDWQASAEKWFLNSEKYNHDKAIITANTNAGKLTANLNKDFGEPL